MNDYDLERTNNPDCNASGRTLYPGGHASPGRTINAPKPIATIEDLCAMETDPDEITRYILTDDIDASSLEWLPLALPRAINLNGANHIIRNLPDSLFHNLPAGSRILRLTLDVNIQSEEDALCGAFSPEISGSTFLNCTVNGTISNIFTEPYEDAQGSKVGGFAGQARECAFRECASNVEIQSAGALYTGGLTGESIGCAFVRCENHGDIAASTGVMGNLTGTRDSGTVIGDADSLSLKLESAPGDDEQPYISRAEKKRRAAEAKREEAKRARMRREDKRPIILDPNNGEPEFIGYIDKAGTLELPEDIAPPIGRSVMILKGWYSEDGARVRKGDDLRGVKRLKAEWIPLNESNASRNISDALSSIIESVASGESAGAKIIDASADSINRILQINRSLYNDDIFDVIDSAHGLAESALDLERTLLRKLCTSLDALHTCALMKDSDETCFSMPDSARNALTNVVHSIAEQEIAAGNLMKSGADALDRMSGDTGPLGEAERLEIEQMFEAITALTDSAADIEEATAGKLCLTVNSLCSCAQEGEHCDINKTALENVIKSVSASEQGASAVMSSAAAMISELAARSNTPYGAGSMMPQAKDLINAALRVEKATSDKLCCVCTALCGVGPIACPCDDICDDTCLGKH